MIGDVLYQVLLLKAGDNCWHVLVSAEKLFGVLAANLSSLTVEARDSGREVGRPGRELTAHVIKFC